ncbi:HAMP domain-containing protein [Spirulina subsalsa FACHB-351]|uniref:histidine kinase n=1 Tax=Spirulina subsalsa FACHB-351 TaxID=234711 RepID=A0ABT3L8K9_9CYAN|nr:cache domain-containing protein [Spirulina subsalsa]MCW6037852.1 HAMP domain-containing protein [Spirulina subsalsa FACHB-351]
MINNSGSKLPLRWIFIIPFMLQILVVVSVVGWLSWWSGQQAITRAIVQLKSEISSRTQEQLDHYFSHPTRLSDLNLQVVALGMLNVNDPEQITRYFAQQMRLYPVSFINFGDEQGNYTGVGRSPNGELYLEIQDTTDDNTGLTTYRLDAQGNRGSVMNQREVYTFKSEEWYQNPVEQRKPLWTDIYLWDDSSGIFSISVSYPLYSNQGQLLGVMGVDLVLSEIKKYLKSLAMNYGGAIFIIERDGTIVAHSSEDQSDYQVENGELTRRNALESSHPMVQGVAQQLIDEYGTWDAVPKSQGFKFRMGGELHFVEVIPWQDELGLDWMIGIIIPESQFTTELTNNTRVMIIVCVVALIIAFGLTIYITSWITRPLEQLNQAAKDLKSDRFQPMSLYAVTSRQDELGELGRTFQDMALVISDRQSNFANQVQQLRQQNSQFKQGQEDAKNLELAYFKALKKKAQSLRRKS